MHTSARHFIFSLVIVSLLGLSAGLSGEKKEKGVWIERTEGYVNILVEENNLQVHFFDSEKKPIEPDVVQAMIHYTSNIVRQRETIVLLPEKGEDEIILRSPRAISPPYRFQLLLVLMFDKEGKKTENHSLFFQQPTDE